MSSEVQRTMNYKRPQKHAVAPRLRFPEFRNTKEWEGTSLGEILSLEYGSPLAEVDRRGGPFPVVGSNGVVGYHDEALISGPAIVVGRKGSAGQINWIASDCYPIDTTFYVRIKNAHNSLMPFLCLVLEISDLEKLKDSGAIPGINRNDVYSIRSFLPKPGEQQKIADCVFSIDELIAAEARRLYAFKVYKKALMQHLFPSEGKTVPRLRFPEFQDAREWEVRTLEHIATYENGKAHENNISENGRYIVVNSKFISTDGAVRKYSDSAFCLAGAGDILMVLSDVPNGKAIAKCYVVDAEDLYTVNQRICKITPAGINGKFLFYILDRNSFFLAFDDGVKQTNLRKEEVVNCPLRLPPFHEEQKKISDLLSSMDDMIAAQIRKLEVLSFHRKGLMQQLLPLMVEVEG
jgi:type I restriction enzyme, S subunit